MSDNSFEPQPQRQTTALDPSPNVRQQLRTRNIRQQFCTPTSADNSFEPPTSDNSFEPPTSADNSFEPPTSADNSGFEPQRQTTAMNPQRQTTALKAGRKVHSAMSRKALNLSHRHRTCIYLSVNTASWPVTFHSLPSVAHHPLTLLSVSTAAPTHWHFRHSVVLSVSVWS